MRQRLPGDQAAIFSTRQGRSADSQGSTAHVSTQLPLRGGRGLPRKHALTTTQHVNPYAFRPLQLVRKRRSSTLHGRDMQIADRGWDVDQTKALVAGMVQCRR